jgi:hypothetical protein
LLSQVRPLHRIFLPEKVLNEEENALHIKKKKEKRKKNKEKRMLSIKKSNHF